MALRLPSSALEAGIEGLADDEAAELVGVAFSVTITKEGLDDGTVVGNSRLTTKVGRAWAERHGIENVRIFRLSDSGDLTALATRFVEFDGDSAVFEADSPNGLSVFSMVALRPLPPTFVVRSLSLSMTTVGAGENVLVLAEVANMGGVQGLYVATLMLDGQPESGEQVLVGPQSSATARFGIAVRTPGRHRLQVGEATATLVVLKPATFEVTGLTVEPSEVMVGGLMTVSAQVSNLGEVAGDYDAALLVDGEPVDSTRVPVGPGLTDKISFAVEATESGEFEVAIGGASGRFRVLSPALFIFTDLSVSPPKVEVGQIASVTVTVTNQGDAEDARIVPFNAGGNTVGSLTVQLAAGASQKLAYVFTPTEPGDYALEVGGLSITLQASTADEGIGSGTIAILIVIGLTLLGGMAAGFWKFRTSILRPSVG